jgi:hypothetical protein
MFLSHTHVSHALRDVRTLDDAEEGLGGMIRHSVKPAAANSAVFGLTLSRR